MPSINWSIRSARCPVADAMANAMRRLRHVGPALAQYLFLALCLFLSITCEAQAQTFSALVLEKRGASQPELLPYTEVPVGSSVSLSPGTKLVFLHYQTCSTVTVLGGKVTFNADAYSVTGGATPKEVKTPCPRVVRLKGDGQPAGIVVRSISPTIHLTTAPAFVLTGPRADEFSAVLISQRSQTVVEAPLTGRRFLWPGDKPALAPNADYDLILVPKGPAKARVTIRFRAQAEARSLSDDQLTLISIEE